MGLSERILGHGADALKGKNGTLAPFFAGLFVFWTQMDGFAWFLISVWNAAFPKAPQTRRPAIHGPKPPVYKTLVTLFSLLKEDE